MDQATFDAVIGDILEGRTLTRALERRGIPNARFYQALNKDPLKTKAYAEAKKYSAEVQIDRIVEIADTEEDPQRARNMIDARKFMASKLLPRVYGDKLQLDVTERIDPAALRAEALARLGMRPSRDLQAPRATQALEHVSESDNVPTDTGSAAGMRSVFD